MSTCSQLLSSGNSLLRGGTTLNQQINFKINIFFLFENESQLSIANLLPLLPIARILHGGCGLFGSIP